MTLNEKEHPSHGQRFFCEYPDIRQPEGGTWADEGCPFRGVPRELETQLRRGVIQELPELVSGEFECYSPNAASCGWSCWPPDTQDRHPDVEKTRPATDLSRPREVRLSLHIYVLEKDFGPIPCRASSFFQSLGALITSTVKRISNNTTSSDRE